MSTRGITIHTSDIEVDKPSGGGKGKLELYIVDVVIDGKWALCLHRHNFKEPGQMARFVELMNELAER